MASNISLPIGVFDSGVGGLTVLNALQKTLPKESYIYLGDTARLPYGTKSSHTVSQYALQAAQYLLNHDVKMLIIACNTATTHALPVLQETFSHIPILGVIEPGARAACEASKSGHIAVIGTEGTVKEKAYDRAILNIRKDARIVSKGCSLLVPVVEEGWIDDSITEQIIRRYLEPLFANNAGDKPDSLILGCTHFPILQNTIKTIVGNSVAVIDSAHTTAQATYEALKGLNLFCENTQESKTTFLVTDSPERFIRTASRFLGYDIAASSVELIDL